MTDLQSPPSRDWATDFDHTKADYAADAPAIWDELRATCPVAHTEAHGGVWLPTRHDDVAAIAHDTENFTSEGVIVSIFKPEGIAPKGYAPPITADPRSTPVPDASSSRRSPPRQSRDSARARAPPAGHCSTTC